MKVSIALSDFLIAATFILPTILKKIPTFKPLPTFVLQDPMFISKFYDVKKDIF